MYSTDKDFKDICVLISYKSSPLPPVVLSLPACPPHYFLTVPNEETASALMIGKKEKKKVFQMYKSKI